MRDCHFKPKEKGLSKKLKENIQEREQKNDAEYSIKPVRKMRYGLKAKVITPIIYSQGRGGIKKNG